jgi:hypothetical protein
MALAAACAVWTPAALAYDPMMTDTAVGRAQASLDTSNSAKPGEAFFAQGVKAVRLNDFSYAVDRYEVAASWGYKPAQYNLGIIYFNGEGGTPINRALAMAWFALAAERGEKKFVDARELAYSEISAEEFAEANELWREMKKTYADDVALDRAKRRWVEVRNAATGSHVGGGTGELAIGSRNMNNANVYKDTPTHSPVPIANSITHTPAGVTGAGAVDGSIAYRQLRATDNPYDPRLNPATGEVTVRDLVPVGDNDTQHSAADKKQEHYY